MDYRREVEKKFISGERYGRTLAHISAHLKGDWVVADATSFDSYWTAPHVDFVRLRENSLELTVKVTDRGTVTDRIEENVVVEKDSWEASHRLATLLFGPPALRLTKRFSVLHTKIEPVPGTSFPAVVCLYEVKEDAHSRVFVEVEAETMKIVDQVLELLSPRLDLTPESRSLFQIFYRSNAK
jgi:hypothetical protein